MVTSGVLILGVDGPKAAIVLGENLNYLIITKGYYFQLLNHKHF